MAWSRFRHGALLSLDPMANSLRPSWESRGEWTVVDVQMLGASASRRLCLLENTSASHEKSEIKSIDFTLFGMLG